MAALKRILAEEARENEQQREREMISEREKLVGSVEEMADQRDKVVSKLVDVTNQLTQAVAQKKMLLREIAPLRQQIEALQTQNGGLSADKRLAQEEDERKTVEMARLNKLLKSEREALMHRAGSNICLFVFTYMYILTHTYLFSHASGPEAGIEK